MTSQRSRAISQSKWFLPAFSAVLGVAILVAGLIGGQPAIGVAGLAVIAAFGLFVLLAGRRSETVRGLRGDGRDERFAMIDLRATALRAGGHHRAHRRLAGRDRSRAERQSLRLAVRDRRHCLPGRNRLLALARLTQRHGGTAARRPARRPALRFWHQEGLRLRPGSLEVQVLGSWSVAWREARWAEDGSN